RFGRSTYGRIRFHLLFSPSSRATSERVCHYVPLPTSLESAATPHERQSWTAASRCSFSVNRTSNSLHVKHQSFGSSFYMIPPSPRRQRSSGSLKPRYAMRSSLPEPGSSRNSRSKHRRRIIMPDDDIKLRLQQ